MQIGDYTTAARSTYSSASYFADAPRYIWQIHIDVLSTKSVRLENRRPKTQDAVQSVKTSPKYAESFQRTPSALLVAAAKTRQGDPNKINIAT